MLAACCAPLASARRGGLSALRLVLTSCLSYPASASPREVHAPATMHATLPADPARPRTIVVGDVHGCLDELKALLQLAEYTPTRDRVVLVGDLVNKGPYSAECVRFARTHGIWAVRGNHDDAAYQAWERRAAARRRGEPVPAGDGRYEWTDALDADDVAYLERLPYTLLLEELDGSDPSLVVHAGLVPGLALPLQEAALMITMRNLVPKVGADGPAAWLVSSAGGPAAWTASAKAHDGVPWATQWKPEPARPSTGGRPVKHVFFGHDAKRGLQLEPHATGLDTGVCYGEQLTAMVLPERRLVSVPAQRVYSQPKGPRPLG